MAKKVAPIDRIKELALEQHEVTSDTGVSKLMGLSAAAVGYWRRKGVTRRTADNIQQKMGWSADYIMDGVGPKLIEGTAPVAKAKRAYAKRKEAALPNGSVEAEVQTLNMCVALMKGNGSSDTAIGKALLWVTQNVVSATLR